MEFTVSEQGLARGRELFAQQCVLCHGASGDGQGARRMGLKGRPADFTSPLWRQRNSAASVRLAITEGKQDTSMAAFRGLDDADVTALTGFVLSLAPGAGRPADAGRAGEEVGRAR